MPSAAAPPAAGLGRVFAACVYDAMLSAAIVFTAAAVAVAVNGGNAVAAADPVFRLVLVAVAFPYYGFCWTHGGQTLGMRTWRLRVETAAGGRVHLGRALLRYLGALLSLLPLGTGFLWIVIDGRRRSWHDMISGTRLVVVAGAGDPARRRALR